MSRCIALANDVDPSSFFELSYRLGIDSDAADFFDIAPRDGLPVSDNRKRFQYRAGLFGRFLKIYAVKERPDRGRALKTPALRDLNQFKSPLCPVCTQRIQETHDVLVRDRLNEQFAQIRDFERLLSAHQGGLNDHFFFPAFCQLRAAHTQKRLRIWTMQAIAQCVVRVEGMFKADSDAGIGTTACGGALMPWGSGMRSSASSSTRSIQRTGTISILFLTTSAISARSLTFSSGMITSRMPPRCAASSFSFNPPIGNTSPLRVISPVIAMSERTGMPVNMETSAVAIAIPAEGPSLGVAPSGTWIWIS